MHTVILHCASSPPLDTGMVAITIVRDVIGDGEKGCWGDVTGVREMWQVMRRCEGCGM